MKILKVLLSASFLAFIILVLLIQGCSKQQKTDNSGLYGKDAIFIDIDRSMVNWAVHTQSGTIQGILKFSKGTFKLNNGMPVSGACTIDMNSIKITDSQDSSENGKFKDYLKSDLFFDTEKYPEAQFTVNSIIPLKLVAKPDVNTTIKSSLTIKDSTLATVITAHTGYFKDSVTCRAKFSLNGALWNIPFSKIKFGNYNKENPFKEDFDIEVYVSAR